MLHAQIDATPEERGEVVPLSPYGFFNLNKNKSIMTVDELLCVEGMTQ